METPDFIAATRKLMSEDDRMALIDYLAGNLLIGDVIPAVAAFENCVGRWKDEANAVALA